MIISTFPIEESRGDLKIKRCTVAEKLVENYLPRCKCLTVFGCVCVFAVWYVICFASAHQIGEINFLLPFTPSVFFLFLSQAEKQEFLSFFFLDAPERDNIVSFPLWIFRGGGKMYYRGLASAFNSVTDLTRFEGSYHTRNHGQKANRQFLPSRQPWPGLTVINFARCRNEVANSSFDMVCESSPY